MGNTFNSSAAVVVLCGASSVVAKPIYINNFLLLHRNKEGGIIPPSEMKIFDAQKNDPPRFSRGDFHCRKNKFWNL